MGGPLIGPDDAHQGLLILDGTWRLVAKMEPDYTKLPVRSLPPATLIPGSVFYD